ncbi:MAG: hypothetical protein DGJ47_000333 [Rickettsiaceae bacterium]
MSINYSLKLSSFNTPLGKMVAVASEDFLYLLDFTNRKGLNGACDKLKKIGPIENGGNKIIDLIEKELDLYFTSKLKQFKTPVYLNGTDFQELSWQSLQQIPYGETMSYLNQAKLTGNSKAFRAVANANAANHLSIIVPCHRVINSNGSLGGYGGGIDRKEWLINHEKNYEKQS